MAVKCHQPVLQIRFSSSAAESGHIGLLRGPYN